MQELTLDAQVNHPQDDGKDQGELDEEQEEDDGLGEWISERARKSILRWQRADDRYVD